jgi:hypothetical protein
MTAVPDDRDARELESTPHDALDGRDVAALTECMSVLPDEGRARDAPGLYTVVSQSGATYLVDARDGACECPDARYRDRECKHLKRVRYATGEADVPPWVNHEAVDPLLGAHVSSTDTDD